MKKLSLIFIITFAFITQLFCQDSQPKVEEKKKILIICDMWEDQIGGTESVVREIRKRLIEKGYRVKFMSFDDEPTFKLPFITGAHSSALPWGTKHIAKKIYNAAPDHVLIVYHGIMSQKAGDYCAKHKIPFTTFYPGRGPECAQAMTGIPICVARYFINNFLSQASNILVPSASLRDELLEEGFTNVIAWPHGIELSKFTLPTPEEKTAATKACNLENRERPFYLYVGRISAEKNMPAFFEAKVPGTKIVVGPENGRFSLETLKKDYPDIVFAGPQYGQDLINYYKAADIFLFPSKMDSFGLVMLEGLASGLPVVGFNTYGPRDVAPKGCGVSFLADKDNQFSRRAKQAWNNLQKDPLLPLRCREYAAQFSWDNAMDAFEKNLIPIKKSRLVRNEIYRKKR